MLIHTESITERDARTAATTQSFAVVPASLRQPEKRGLLAAIGAFFEVLLPVGYEDERGFHLGSSHCVQQPHTTTATTPLDNDVEVDNAPDQTGRF